MEGPTLASCASRPLDAEPLAEASPTNHRSLEEIPLGRLIARISARADQPADRPRGDLVSRAQVERLLGMALEEAERLLGSKREELKHLADHKATVTALARMAGDDDAADRFQAMGLPEYRAYREARRSTLDALDGLHQEIAAKNDAATMLKAEPTKQTLTSRPTQIVRVRVSRSRRSTCARSSSSSSGDDDGPGEPAADAVLDDLGGAA